jgi:hypothetical protein
LQCVIPIFAPTAIRANIRRIHDGPLKLSIYDSKTQLSCIDMAQTTVHYHAGL